MSGRDEIPGQVWRVPLPAGAQPPYRVWVNGVPQAEGQDYAVRAGALCFTRPLAKEGKLGLGRWLLGSVGIGTYRKNDSVDVQFTRHGREELATALDIEPPPGWTPDG